MTKKEIIHTLKLVKKGLQKVRRKALPLKTSNHYIDYDYRTWTNPIDGLDYAIHLINKRIKVHQKQ